MDKSVRLAVLCGISRYEHFFPNLPVVEKELNALADLLANQLHEDYRYKVEVYPNADISLNKQDLKSILRELSKRRVDELLLYVAGHGCLVDNTSYLVLPQGETDEPGLRLGDLQHDISKISLPKRKFVILDFCHSGGFLEGYQPLTDVSLRGAEDTAVFASCGPKELSSAGREQEQSFTHYLIEALKGKHAASHGTVYWGDVGTYVALKMEDSTFQRPIIVRGGLGSIPVNQLRDIAPDDSAVEDVRGLIQARILQPFHKFKQQLLYLGTRQLTFAGEQSRFFPRHLLEPVLETLATSGHALVIGPAGSGKTVLALQLAWRIEQGQVPDDLKGLAVFYCKAATMGTQPLELVENGHPMLLIIDDAHEDELNARHMLKRWIVSRQDQQTGVRLLFLSQSYFGDDSEKLSDNLFHQHATRHKALPDDGEFVAMLRHMWSNDPGAPPSDAMVNRVRLLVRNSPALAGFAVEIAHKLHNVESIKEERFQRELLQLVMKHHQLEPLQQAVTTASILTAYDVPIVREAMDLDSADQLIRQKFLVPHRTVKGCLEVFSSAIAQLQLKFSQLTDQGVASVLQRYMSLPSSNYLQVLVGVRQARERKLLHQLVNDGLPILQERLKAEQSLEAAALTLEIITECGRGAARDALEAHLDAADLLVRLTSPLEKAPAVGRYLRVATYLKQDVLFERLPKEGPSRDRTLIDVLEMILSSARLTDVTDICTAVSRCSRETARHLLSATIKKRQLSSSAPGGMSLEYLRFLGTISRLDRKLIKTMFQEVTDAQLVTLVLSTVGPAPAMVALRSIEALNRRQAQRVLQGSLRHRQFPLWAQRLVQPPTHLHNLGRLIFITRHISAKLCYAFAVQMSRYLEEAVKKDGRLSAISYLLLALRRANPKVASSLLRNVAEEGLLSALLLEERSPARFGRSILAIAHIDRLWTDAYVTGMSQSMWEELFTRARTIGAAALLLKGAAHATHAPDELILKILSMPVRTHLVKLAKESYGVDGLAQFAEIVAGTVPLTQSTRQSLLQYATSDLYLKALDNVQDMRKLAMGLAAFATAWPVKANQYVMDLLEKLASQRQSGNAFLRRLKQLDDLPTMAFLLNCTAEIDGRLATAISAEIAPLQRLERSKVCRSIRREPHLTRTSAVLHALARVNPEVASALVRHAFRPEQLPDIISSCSDLRELVIILGAFRAADFKSYLKHMRTAIQLKRQLVEQEILLRVQEESNLGILGQALSLVACVDEKLATGLLQKLEMPWVMEFARWDNAMPQVLSFVSTAARLVRDAGTGVNPVKILLNQDLLERMAELHSIRAISLCLVELFRTMTHLNIRDLLMRAWACLPHSSVARQVEYSDDLIGCGLLSLQLLMTPLSTSPSANLVAAACSHTISHSYEEYGLAGTLAAIAMGGSEISRLKCMELLSYTSARPGACLWEIGLSNWLAQQRQMAQKRPASSMFITRNMMPLDPDSTEISDIVLDECERSGSNARLLFVLAAARQMSLRLSDAVEARIRAGVKQRCEWEWRPNIRNQLQLVLTGPLEAQVCDLESATFYVRELSPRFEAANLEEEEEELD